MPRYFTGDDVIKTFDVEDELGAVNPSAVSVRLMKPDKTFVDLSPAAIDGNRVSEKVMGVNNDIPGNYTLFFVCTLPGYGIRTNDISYVIEENPE